MQAGRRGLKRPLEDLGSSEASPGKPSPNVDAAKRPGRATNDFSALKP
jgi:hypothetical protein